MNVYEFKATWDKKLLLISLLTTILFGIVIFDTISSLSLLTREMIFIRFCLVIIFVTTSLLFYITKYRISTSSILVQHLGWSRSFDLKLLSKYERVAKCNGFGIFGVWGILSFSGIAYSKAHGFHSRYITNHANVIALMFGEKVVLLSPNDPGKFIKELEKLTDGCGKE